jgi:hypothetical protein
MISVMNYHILPRCCFNKVTGLFVRIMQNFAFVGNLTQAMPLLYTITPPPSGNLTPNAVPVTATFPVSLRSKPHAVRHLATVCGTDVSDLCGVKRKLTTSRTCGSF